MTNKVLPFAEQYDKLEWTDSGTRGVCVGRKRYLMGSIPLQFLLRDVKCKSWFIDLSKERDGEGILGPIGEKLRQRVYDFFKRFGYKNFDSTTEMEIFWFDTGKDIIHTIRKPNSYEVGDSVTIIVRGEG